MPALLRIKALGLSERADYSRPLIHIRRGAIVVSAKHANYFDYVLDTVSDQHNLEQPFNMMKRQGTLIMVGASPEPLPLALFPMVMRRRKMMGSLIGGLPETQEM